MSYSTQHLFEHYRNYYNVNKSFIDPIRGNDRIENYCAYLILIIDNKPNNYNRLINEISNKIISLKKYDYGYDLYRSAMVYLFFVHFQY